MSAVEGHTSFTGRPQDLQQPPRHARARRIPIVTRVLLAAATSVLLLGLAYWLFAPASVSRVASRRAPLAAHGLLSLPASLQGPASDAVAARNPAYWGEHIAGGVRVENPAQLLTTTFEREGLTVRSGGLMLGLSLVEARYGARREAIAPASPVARANHVTYQRRWLSEWYANGPVGLEQGFTVARVPAGRASATLTLSLATSGGARASMLGGGRGVLFSGSGSSLLYGAPTARDARGRTLHSWLQLRGGRIELGVDTRGAAYPLRIDPFIQQGSKITAGELGAGIFGYNVAISPEGNTALVGAPNDSPRNVFREGAVWVFTRSGETWTQQGEPLTAGQKSEDVYFGTGLALSANGNTAVIGATGGGVKAEPAYVFTRTGSKWSVQAHFEAAGEGAKGNFGDSVALSENGNTALVGASGESSGAGAAFVFVRSGSSWEQQGGKLSGEEESGSGAFGEAVAIDAEGNIALVGGPADNTNKGAMWMFKRAGSTWTQFGKKVSKPEGEAGEGHFGERVALSRNSATALVGAPEDNEKKGAAWVFTRSGESWTEQGPKLTGGAEEKGQAEFGARVALGEEGSTALIGGPEDNTNVGAAWAFTRTEGKWTQQGSKLIPSDEAGKAGVGGAVALAADGNTAFIGGGCDEECHGAAWAFTRSAGKWSQEGEKLTGTIEAGAAHFGTDTAISADGKTALIGAYQDNGDHGAVWVFTRSGSEWVHQGNELTGGAEEVGDAEFGQALALSADGNTALVGGQLDEGEKLESQQGAVWVFTRSGGKWKQQGKKITDPGKETPGGPLFGSSVALSADGNTGIIGTRGEKAAYVFTRTGETWTEQQKLTPPAIEKEQASFGLIVALSSDGGTAVVANFLDNESKGGVWVFTKRNGSWTQQGPKLTGVGEAGEQFGAGIGLSEDGSTLLVGANDSSPAGAAYVFTRTGESWAQQGEKLVGAGASPFASDFGSAVALSGDGNTALIGAGAQNANTGAVWEYKRSESVWHQVGEKFTGSGEEGETGFGGPIALSADGTTALIGGTNDDANYGAVWSFMESPGLGAPSATEITSSEAKLSASVNPQGEEVTECKFEYGTTTGYEGTKTCSPMPGSGTSPAVVSAEVSGLEHDKLYHFRISANNGHGIQQSPDQTFTTLETSETGSSENPAKPAEAKQNGLSVTGTGGTGKVTIGPYGQNKAGAGLPGGEGTYFQVYRSEGASFTQIQYTDCELGGAKALWWDNPETGWEPIPESMALYTGGATPCITVTATPATKPSIAQLSDPRHVGGPVLKGQYGKCESAKHGAFGDADCKTPDITKGKAKGSYEWYAAPAPACFPLKHGFYSNETIASGAPVCEGLDEKKKKGKGNYESGENTYKVDGGPIALSAGGQTVLECTSSTSHGEETSSNQGIEQIDYVGCKDPKGSCTSGAEAGSVASAPLESYVSKEVNETETGQYLAVLAGKEETTNVTDATEPRRGPVMKFTCGTSPGTTYMVRGAVEGKLARALNAMTSEGEIEFAKGVGAQELIVEEGGTALSAPVLTSTGKLEYAQAIEFGEVGEFPKRDLVELKQRLQGEKKYYWGETPTVEVGRYVEYEVVLRNLGPVPRDFSPLSASGCENITPDTASALPAGGSETFTCDHLITAVGPYSNVVTISANEHFGTKESDPASVTGVPQK